MKNLYTSKKFQKLTFLFAAFLSLGVVMTSCKKDEDTDPYTDHTVGFEVKSIPGPNIPAGQPSGIRLKAVSYQIGVDQTPTLFNFGPTDPAVSNWVFGDTGLSVTDASFWVNSSKSAVYFSANAIALDPKAKMVTNLYIDGMLKKTDTVKAPSVGGQMVTTNGKLEYSFIGLQ